MIDNLFESTRIIAILRKVPIEFLDKTISALVNGGIRLAEITLNSPNSLQAISHLREKDISIGIGAGTVITKQNALDAISAGAQFIVTPNINSDVIEICKSKNIPVFPGALTPTEMAFALSVGAKYIKLFPASSMGAGYIKELRGPLDKAKIIAVGGISHKNAAEYLQAGAAGVGIGGSLCNLDLIMNENFDEITRLSQELLNICKKRDDCN